MNFIEGVVTGRKKKKATLEFLVHSGAVYTLVPEKAWKAIGLKSKRRMTFTLADGTKVDAGFRNVTSGCPKEKDTLPSSSVNPVTNRCLGPLRWKSSG